MSIIDLLMETFFNRLGEKHNYNSDILNSEWNILNREFQEKIKNTLITTTVDSLTVSLDKLTVKDDEPKQTTCQYKMTRGVHANTICNGRVKIGHVVCSKHIKYEAQFLNVPESSPSPPKITNKSRAKIVTKTPIVHVDIINTCKTPEDEHVNFDSMQVHEINQLYRDFFKCDFDVYKDRNMSLEEIFVDKKRKLVESMKDKPIKITLTKWNQIEHSPDDIVSVRTKNNVILNLVKYKQSGYWVDKNSLVIVKSVEEPIVIGRINRYEQPTLHIDGYTYDLILQYNFDFDLNALNDEGKEAHEAFLNCNNSKTDIVSNDTIPQDEEILL